MVSYALLGFAVKARKVVYGLDAIERAIARVRLVLYDDTLSQNSLDKAQRIALRHSIPIAHVSDKMQDVVHKLNCKIIGVIDDNFAKAILEGKSTKRS
jgi:ribosomal protein L7Ae-like RNA K-turn-binding protein